MTKSAQEYLLEAANTIDSRGKTYDQGAKQERSMAKIVATFNVITGLSLTEQQGWLFMQCLKLVRLHAGKWHEDSALDAIAYAALSAECGGQDEAIN